MHFLLSSFMSLCKLKARNEAKLSIKIRFNTVEHTKKLHSTMGLNATAIAKPQISPITVDHDVCVCMWFVENMFRPNDDWTNRLPRVLFRVVCVCDLFADVSMSKATNWQPNKRRKKKHNICIPFGFVFLFIRSTMRNITKLLCNNQRKTKGYGFENDGKDSIKCDNLSKDLPSNNNNILFYSVGSFFFDDRRSLSLPMEYGAKTEEVWIRINNHRRRTSQKQQCIISYIRFLILNYLYEFPCVLSWVFCSL